MFKFVHFLFSSRDYLACKCTFGSIGIIDESEEAIHLICLSLYISFFPLVMNQYVSGPWLYWYNAYESEKAMVSAMDIYLIGLFFWIAFCSHGMIQCVGNIYDSGQAMVAAMDVYLICLSFWIAFCSFGMIQDVGSPQLQ